SSFEPGILKVPRQTPYHEANRGFQIKVGGAIVTNSRARRKTIIQLTPAESRMDGFATAEIVG
ncbi:hypothetical protein AVEN_18496-1, partial [Araneus ventricosus]